MIASVTTPGYGHPLRFGVSLTPRHDAADAVVALAQREGALAVPHGAEKIVLVPATDPRLSVRCDVGTVESAEGCFERTPARVRNGIGLIFGMARHAPRGLREVLTALRVAVGGDTRAGDGEEERRRELRAYHVREYA